MRTNNRNAWLVIGAAALAAMLAGHACELWLEGVHAFGERQAQYHHVGQGPVAELALLLFIAAAIGILRFLARNVGAGKRSGEELLPALHSIVDGGVSRLAGRLITLQMGALLVTEFFEQRLSGYTGNALASIAGPGHATTVAVHALIGTAVALVLYLFARFACARTRVLVEAVIAIVRRTGWQPARDAAVRLREAFTASVFSRDLSLIALGLAKRPPPKTSATSA
jgi:hypothetical protein